MKRTPKLLLAAAGTVAVALPLGLLANTLGGVGVQALTQSRQAAPTASKLVEMAKGSEIVDAANAFLARLTEAQRALAQVELTADLASRWSNFPDGVVPRNGVFFRDLSPEQVAAALKVARLALSEEGFTRYQEIRAGDDLHGSLGGGRGPGGGGGNGGSGPGGPGAPQGKGAGGQRGGGARFGSSNYMIAFLGQPSNTTAWLLQLGGHHVAFNIYFKGSTGSVSPYFVGVEPTSWKDAEGKTHAPLAPMRDAMYELVNSLTPDQLQKAKLDARFSDVYVGPGRDGKFPTSEGVPAGELSDASRDFVKQAIAAWTGDTPQAGEYRALYAKEIDRTKVAYSGSTTLNNVGDYVRIDGPHVWIEFSCQRGVHYHTIWRDRFSDYGAEFSF